MKQPAVNPPLTAALEQLVIATFAVRRAVTRRLGVSETELGALEHLSMAASSPSELARLLRVSTAASTGVVDRLEAHGHVERRRHPTDRRRQEVHLTASGRAEMDHQLEPMLEALAALEESLTTAEQDTVLRFLAGAVQAYGLVAEADA